MKTPYGGNRYLYISKLPCYMTPVLGYTEAVRAEPFSKPKTDVSQLNFRKRFKNANAVRKAKRSSKIMVAGLSTSRRENIKYPKKMRVSLSPAESTYGSCKTSYRDSLWIFGDENVVKPMVAKLSTCYLKPTNRGQVSFPGVLMSKGPKMLFNEKYIFLLTPVPTSSKVLVPPVKQEEIFTITPKPILQRQFSFSPPTMSGVL